MTVKELQTEIRRLTRSVNVKLAEYFQKRPNEQTDKMIAKMREGSAWIDRQTGELKVPKGYEGGYLGLGFKGKKKDQLEQQLLDLQAFNIKEQVTDEYRWKVTEKSKLAYKTFTERYGDISYKEWEDFADLVNTIGGSLKDYGYEDIGGSIAFNYADAIKRGKQNMKHYIRQAKEKAAQMQQLIKKPITPEGFT